MTSPPSSPVGQADGPALRFLADLPVLVLVGGIAALLGRTFAGRVGYPYDLEWMEGGMLVHAWRVMHGQALYVQPSWEFVPFIYPPLYSWLLGALGHVFGLGYALGRTVSFVGTLVGAAALVAAVRGERGTWALGLGAAGLFLSGYENAGSFYDLVRIDGLLIALLSWSLVAVRHGWLRTGGLLLVAAYATKHNAALFGLPALIWLWRGEGRSAALRFAGWSMIPALAFTAAMQLEGDGLFLTYILGVPARHPLVVDRLFPGAPRELFMAMPWTAGAAAVVGLLMFRGRGSGGRYWLSQGVLAVLLCAFMRAHHGGYLNVLVPGLWVMALWGGLAASAVVRRWPSVWVRAAAGALVAWQIWAGRWDPARYLPTEADRAAGDQVLTRLAEIDGDVLAPWSPWYPVMVGKQPYLHLIGLWDIDHEGGPLEAATHGFTADMDAQRWAVVLTANDEMRWGLKQNYEQTDRIRFSGKAAYPRTGWRVRPTFLFTPRR